MCTSSCITFHIAGAALVDGSNPPALLGPCHRRVYNMHCSTDTCTIPRWYSHDTCIISNLIPVSNPPWFIPTWYLFHTHLIPISYPYDTYFIPIWYLFHTHMIHVSYPYDTYFIPIWYLFHTHMIHVSYPYDTYFIPIPISYPYDTCFIPIWYLFHTHMIPVSYSGAHLVNGQGYYVVKHPQEFPRLKIWIYALDFQNEVLSQMIV
jgi:hypothetical protein